MAKLKKVLKTGGSVFAIALAFSSLAIEGYAASGQALTVDLAGESTTATSLTADTVYVNSSDTTASLIFENSESVEFLGKIDGNIAVVKQGTGELTLSSTNTYSGGTIVSNGWLKVCSDANVGRGLVWLDGGNLCIGTNWTPDATCIVLKKNATIDVSSNTFTVKPSTFKTAGCTMTKIGSGKLSIGAAGFKGESTDGAKWIIEEGSIGIGRLADLFGGYNVTADLTIELHEGTYLLAESHLPLPAHVILRGAELRGANDEVATVETSQRWKSFSLNGNLTVFPSSTGRASSIHANAIHVGNNAFVPEIIVQEGAELVMNTSLARGRRGNNASLPLTSGSFVKRGEGTLAIVQPGTLAGVVRIEDGTVRFGKDGGVGRDASLIVSPEASVVLDDGAVLDCRYGGDNLLTSADVWIDATSYVADEGSTVDVIANRGRCGGSFVAGKGATANGGDPACPTFKKLALNGRPAFSFDGSQALALDTYVNKSSEITVFGVVRCTHWENTGNKGKWAAYLAMHSSASGNTDGNVSTSLYHQDNGNYQWIFGTGNNVNLNHDATINHLPAIDCIRKSGTSADAVQYVYKAGEVTSKTATRSRLAEKFDIDFTAIGCRINKNGKLEYHGKENTATRCFYGDIGEILIFSRSVTDDERSAINEYLSRKWFGITNSSVTASIYSSNIDVASISVPNGTATLLTPQEQPGVLKKTGSGTLMVNEVSSKHDLHVDQGTLALMPTSVLPLIDVWMDAADLNAVSTNADGRVLSVRNKGNSGGVFCANPRPQSETYGAPTPKWSLSGINSLPSLEFAGDSALTLDSYTNANPYGFLTVFMVAERSSDIDTAVGGYGKWSAPITLASRDNRSTDNAQEGAFHYEEADNGKGALGRLYRGPNKEVQIKDIMTVVPSDQAFLFTAYLCGYHQYYNFESSSSDAESGVVASKTFDSDDMWPTDINCVQLGCRLDGYGKAPLYGPGDSKSRAWYGRIGEVIVCTATLSDEQKQDILAYLRKKWMNKGIASGVQPPVLTGIALAGTLGADTSLNLAAGASIASGTVAQPIASLTVGESATLVRSGVTDPVSYPMFTVGGIVSLPENMTFHAESLPSEDANILTFGAMGDTIGTEWKVVSDKVGPHIINSVDAVRLLLHRGLHIIVK